MLPTLRVLLVEDNPINQKVASAILTKAGHVVTFAGNGKEALDRVTESSFDIVLMDVQMPEMDGIEATVHIRRGEADAGGHLPIVAVTAHAMASDRDACIAAGMDGYVTKPIIAPKLFEAMADALNKRAG